MSHTDSLLATLTSCNWDVIRRHSSENFLPDEVRKRYPGLPTEVALFLGGLEVCVNQSKTVWFLTHDDYCQNSNGRFRWNEHELMSLDASRGDTEETERIRAFWNLHFPFMFAVHSDYDYLAIDLRPEAYGQIVHGYMPEPEEVSMVAPSFEEFVIKFGETFRGRLEYPLAIFK